MADATTKILPSLAEGFPTPPESALDNFSKMEVSEKSVPKVAPVQTPPSPVSPAEGSMLTFVSSVNYPVHPIHPAHDALLYPDAEGDHGLNTQTPLFADTEASSTSGSDSAATPPSQSPQFRPAVQGNLGSIIGPGVYIEESSKGVWKYYLDRMAELDRIKEAHRTLPQPVQSTASERDNYTIRQLEAMLTTRQKHFAEMARERNAASPNSKPVGVVKNKSPPKSTTKTKAVKATTPAPAALPSKRTPKSTTPLDSHEFASPSGQSSKHKRAPPTKKTFTNDSEWRTFEDFCPPVSSLDDADKPLKAGWGKSSTMDITSDADYSELHAAEAAVASELRLHPVQYLANKRRIFNEKVKRLQAQQSFTKTAAQNVCNIDVNKVSKLWEAFAKVGWFDDHWFQQYL